MEKVGIFYGHLEYITAIWYILGPFGNFVSILYIFHGFGILCQEKSGNPEVVRYLGTDRSSNSPFFPKTVFFSKPQQNIRLQNRDQGDRMGLSKTPKM
jgi:hypothetical protein